MFITKTSKCYFVLGTDIDIENFKIKFDSEFIMKFIDPLKKLYLKYILPELTFKTWEAEEKLLMIKESLIDDL